MYKLIADSGATKTDWASDANGELKFFTTAGLNPHLLTEEEIVKVIKEEVFPEIGSGETAEILFYGSGCADTVMKNKIMNSFLEAMPVAGIQVSTDLEAAGIALFGSGDGLACILGTGSNAGIYSGGLLLRQMQSKVFPEGDRGGGAAIILAILKDLADQAAPDEVSSAMEHIIGLSPDEYLIRLEEGKLSRTEVASLYKKMTPLFKSDYLEGKIREEIRIFMEEVMVQFPDESCELKWGFIGSIALLNEHLIREIASELGIEVAIITGKPIKELYNYLKEKYD